MSTKNNKYQDKRLDNIEGSVEVINKEMGNVKEDIASMKTDIHWIKKFIFAILPLLAGMVIALIYIIIK